jgi:hypothetical protein
MLPLLSSQQLEGSPNRETAQMNAKNEVGWSGSAWYYMS